MGNEWFTPYGIGIACAIMAAAFLYAVRMPKARVSLEPEELLMACLPLGLLCARLFYVVFRFPFYESIGFEHILYLREGGYLLYGALTGTVLAIAMIAKQHGEAAGRLLDAVTCPGLLCIAAARLAEGLAGEGVGNWVENEHLAFFPLAVTNEYGEVQWAIFVFEAAAAVIIMGLLWRRPCGNGLVFAQGLAMYAACQLIFESLRRDSVLKVGFVRVSQVLSAVVLLILALILRRDCAWRNRVAAVLTILAGAGSIAITEWALEKTQIENVILYLFMAVLALIMLLCTLGLWPPVHRGQNGERRPAEYGS